MLRIILCSLILATVYGAPRNVIRFEIKSKDYKNVEAFSFKDCGGKIAHAHSLSVTPDPLQFPGTFNLAFNVSLTDDLATPLQVSFLIEKELFGKYVKIPCVDNFGSCTYPDLCQILQNIGGPCPDELQKAGIPCKCPYKAGNYVLPTIAIDVDADPFPTGGYHLQAQINSKSQSAVCLDVYLSVSD